ncbi:MAG: MlaD family protein, partial [Gordonia sp. (in: high G+C Gram-positive bacteria)]
MLTVNTTPGTRSRKKRSTSRVVLGVVALGIILTVVLTGCSLVPESWRVATGQAKTYTAYFDSVAGLYNGNDVAVLGMPVGRITAVEQ